MDRTKHRVATDIVVTDGDRVVLIERGQEPFEGMWCLPGGHVEQGEQVRDAAVREVREETGLDVELERVLGIYDAPGRDPRGPVISVAYVARPVGGELDAATDAAGAAWFDLEELPDEMGFDHAEILEDFRHDRQRL